MPMKTRLKMVSLLLLLGSLMGWRGALAHAAPLQMNDLTQLIKGIDTENNLQIAATPEVLATLNHLHLDPASRAAMHVALQRLNRQQQTLGAALKRAALPDDLRVLVLIDAHRQAAFSSAALHKLTTLRQQFENWKLALLAYKYGVAKTHNLIEATGTTDVWEIARAAHTPKDVQKYLALFDASVIIMHNPGLVTGG